jgi:hypothetical protein
MRRISHAALAGIAAIVSACGSDRSVSPVQTKTSALTVTFAEGNPTCESLGLSSFSYKIDPPLSGNYSLDGLNNVTVTITDGIYVDWSGALSIDAVIVKGGPNANVYSFSPESFGATGLSAPINPNTDRPYGLSHVDFCFDYELAVSKTAITALQRTWPWTIDKSSTVSTLTLSTGQTYAAPFDVTVTAGAPVDSNWKVSGVITVRNPAPFAATIASIADSMAAATCGVTFPYVLASGGTLSCTYEAALAGPSSGTNHVDVATTGVVGGGAADRPFDFTAAAVTERDACVDVNDDHYGALGRTCRGTSPYTYHYTADVGPFADCGPRTFTNTASFAAVTTGATGSDAWAIAVDVPCDVGCTLTQGYWKTHSTYGPAKHADDAWLLLSAGPDTTFFSSGQTYIQVLRQTSTNVYYTLARQYIAAQLNGLNGASLGSISATFDSATALLNAFTPADTVAWSAKSSLRQQFLTYARALDDFNNGVTGPGHCSE